MWLAQNNLYQQDECDKLNNAIMWPIFNWEMQQEYWKIVLINIQLIIDKLFNIICFPKSSESVKQLLLGWENFSIFLKF